jgi:hypothetical protein
MIPESEKKLIAPCEKLEKQFRDDNTKQTNLMRIHKIGLNAWLDEIRKG